MSIFSPQMMLGYLFSFNFLHAALTTVWISLASLLVGMLIGLLLAAGQEVPSRIVRGAIMGYLWLFRGTPVLLQLVFAFNVLPLFHIVLPAYACAVLALGLNEGAYMTEIIRSGLMSVDPGQREAARALGMTKAKAMRRIVMPQALRVIIPPTGNQFIAMLKDSSLVSVVGVWELMYLARTEGQSEFRHVEMMITASLIYWLFSILLELIQGRIERYYGRAHVR